MPRTSKYDKPIAYRRCFVSVAGSVHAAVMLSQAVYWSRRTKDPEGWFWKTQEQWEDETGLTRYEQEGARGKLRECDFWQEKRRGVPAKMYFHVDEYILDEAVDAWIEHYTEEREQQRSTARKTGKPLSKKGTKQQSSMGKSTILDTEKSPDILYTESTPESTTENTPKTTNARGAAKQKLTQNKADTKEPQYETGDVTEAFDRLHTFHAGYFGTHSF